MGIYFSLSLCRTEENIVLNLELFIARRLLKGKGAVSVSVPIVKIAVAGIALGVCVMLLSVFITTGFKREITDKLSGFMSHLDITGEAGGDAYTGGGIVMADSLLALLRETGGVKQAVPYITKPAILKSGTEIHGVILRGLDSLYDASFYNVYLSDGKFPRFDGGTASPEILISASVATLLQVGTGDRIAAHFVQDPPRVRMFTVAGIYDTGFKEYDDMFAICDIRHLRRLNGWQQGEVTGVGIELHDLRGLPSAENEIGALLPLGDENGFFRITSLQESAPQVFDWLELLNMNVVIILTLIVVVAGFNMVSGLLILILDKTALIGILKALGYTDVSLRKLFLYVAVGLISKGMLVGNLLAFLLGALQHWGGMVRLDPATYYMDTVPVSFDLGTVLLLNTGVLLVSVLMLLVPTVLISKIRPIKAIRFE